MRYKKQIIIICLFTFLFLPIHFKVNEIEVEAEPITMTYLAYEVITALLVSSGIVITGQAVHNALVSEFNDTLYGQEKYARARMEMERIVNQPTVGEVAFDNFSDIVKEVYQLSYTDYVEKTYNLDTTVFGDNKISVPDTYAKQGQVLGTYQFSTATGDVSAVFRSSMDFESTSMLDLAPGLCSVVIHVSWYGPGERLECKITDSQGTVRTLLLGDNDGYEWKNVSLTLGGDFYGIREKISFAPDWTDYRGVNEDINFGDFGGSICADKTLDYGNDKLFDNTKDYSYPLDNVGQLGGITYNPGATDTDKPITGVPDVSIPDKPVIDDVETPVTGESLWDTLFGWLKTLLSAITNLLSWIGDILLSLLDGLKSLLIFLFVPKQGYFVDKFNNWKNNFSSKFFLDLSQLEDLKGLSEQGVKDIHFKIMGVDVVLKLSIINSIAEYSRTIALGVTIISLIWYNYRNVYKLIRGSSPIEGVTGHYGGDK